VRECTFLTVRAHICVALCRLSPPNQFSPLDAVGLMDCLAYPYTVLLLLTLGLDDMTRKGASIDEIIHT
jgi:hypothetical protein